MSMNASGDILIAGAGPTGLATACTLLRHGVECRVVDRRQGPASEPKALILWSGALEILRRLGVDGPLRDRSLPLAGASYWSRGRAVGGVRFGALEGTAFPRPLCVPQSVTEGVLYDRLLQLGGQVEWNTEVVDARAVPAGASGVAEVTLAVHGMYQSEDACPRWLIGADGTHSRIRESAGILFEGGSYARTFLLGDGEYDGDLPSEEVQYHLTPQGVLVVVPLPGGGHRIFFDREPGGDTAPPSEEDLQQLLDARGPADWALSRTWWRSTFQVHTKVASTFRRGNVFVAGDAAHCHSPAGGQGLNTGVQDGYDLGWKLAAVTRGADMRLLDSYEAERRPAALRAIRNSDRQTKLWMLRNGPGRVFRDIALSAATRSGALDRKMVPELAQIDPRLADSPAVPGAVGQTAAAAPASRKAGPQAGRRLPDTLWEPLTGTRSQSAHAFLSAGRHVFLVLTRDSPDGAGAELSRRTALLAQQSPDHGQTDVVLLAREGAGGGVPAGDGDELPYAVAVERKGNLTGWAGTGPLVVYVRPDGVTGGWCGPDGLDTLFRQVSTGTGRRSGTGDEQSPRRSAA